MWQTGWSGSKAEGAKKTTMRNRVGIGIVLLLAALQGCAISPGMKMHEPAKLEKGQVVRVVPISLALLNEMDAARETEARNVVNEFSAKKERYRIGPGDVLHGYLLPDVRRMRATWGEVTAFCIEHGIRPQVGHVFGFDEAARAHRLIESRESYGKVVLRV